MKGLAMFFFLICTIIYKDFDICQSKSYYAFTELGSHLYSFVYKNTVQCCHNLGLKSRNVKM